MGIWGPQIAVGKRTKKIRTRHCAFRFLLFSISTRRLGQQPEADSERPAFCPVDRSATHLLVATSVFWAVPLCEPSHEERQGSRASSRQEWGEVCLLKFFAGRLGMRIGTECMGLDALAEVCRMNIAQLDCRPLEGHDSSASHRAPIFLVSGM